MARFLLSCSTIGGVEEPAVSSQPTGPLAHMAPLDKEWQPLLSNAPQLMQPLGPGAHGRPAWAGSPCSCAVVCSTLALVPVRTDACNQPCLIGPHAGVLELAADDIVPCAIVPLLWYAEAQEWLRENGGSPDVDTCFSQALAAHIAERVLAQPACKLGQESVLLAHR